jgi:hypothetical protein
VLRSIDAETYQAWSTGGIAIADEIVATITADEGERRWTTMGAGFAAA